MFSLRGLKEKLEKLKVLTIVGTRPEIIRLSRVIAKLDQHCNHVLVHTGQNYDYELNQVFFDDLGIRKPDYFLACAENSIGVANTIGNIITEIDKVLSECNPQAILILGDTNSCLSAIPAKRRKIPIFHMEAGNRCFDQRVPEEINRKIVDHIADINMPYSTISRDYLIAEGIPPDQIIKTGSPMHEVLTFYMKDIDNSNILYKLNIERQNYFLISAHREENVDPPEKLLELSDSLNLIAKSYSLPVIVSTHPRTKNRITNQGINFHKNIKLLQPMGFFDYNHLQKNARAVLSDSGTINEESSILNFPALNIREAHERPEAMEEASVMMTGLSPNRIMQSLKILETQTFGNERLLLPVDDYSMPNVSDKVVRIIHSYVDYVKRVVWKDF